MSQREIPACVEACPTNALVFFEVKELSGAKRTEAALKMARGMQGKVL